MYSPTTRLLTILELLQSHAQMSGAELARRLEVDGRSVRRYIVRLQEMGIPVETELGPHGCYRLRRGFKLPPLMFTDQEAVAIILGLMAMREMHLPVEATAVEGALAKTERVMPEALLAQARALQEAITFHGGRTPVQTRPDFVTRLSLAVQQRRRVRLRYRAWHAEASQREIEPYGIVVHEGFWYAAGYCHLRNGLRTFRLDRIEALELTGTGFERPASFDPLAYVLESLTMGPGNETVEVLMMAPLDQVQHVIWRCSGTLEATPEGVLYRRGAYHLEWVALFLLSLDFPCVVKQPQALRDMIRKQLQAGQRMLKASGHI